MGLRIAALAALTLATTACQTPVPLSPLPPNLLEAQGAGGARVIVKAPGLGSSEFSSLGKRHGLKLERRIAALGCALYRPEGATMASLAALSREPRVKYIERDAAGGLFGWEKSGERTKEAPAHADQWDMQKMHVKEAWQVRAGAAQTVVAVLDTGLDLDHPALSSKVVEGANVTTPDEAPQDDVGHGTAVAGIIGAEPLTPGGFSGVAPQTRLMPVKVNQPQTGSVRAFDTAEGIVWAVDHGANVLNMSLGFEEGEPGLTPESLQTLKEALAYALSKSVTVVCASGNTKGSPSKTYPAMWAGTAGFEGLLAVGATDNRDQRASYSNYGPWLTVMAPADDVPSLSIGGYGRFGGTSAAAPHVSGLVALLTNPSRPPSPKNLKDWVVAGARDLGRKGFDPQTGFGLVDALASAQASTR